MDRFLLCLILLTCLLVACNPSCPENYIQVQLEGKPACISTLSFCQSNQECASAKFICDTPCSNEPVNRAHLELAENKAQTCNSQEAGCRLSPEIVKAWCQDFQCRAQSYYVEDFVVPPQYLEVETGKEVCYTTQEESYTLHFKVYNADTKTLSHIESIIVGDKQANSEVIPHAFISPLVLDTQVAATQTHSFTYTLDKEVIGLPRSVTLYAGQSVVVNAHFLGNITNRVKPTRFVNIEECEEIS